MIVNENEFQNNIEYYSFVISSNITEEINKVSNSDANFISDSIDSFLIKFNSQLKEKETSPLVEFNLKSLFNLNFEELIQNIKTKYSQVNSLKSVILFICIKYLIQSNELVDSHKLKNEECIFKFLNEEYSNVVLDNTIYITYRYKLLDTNIKINYQNISNDKNNFFKNDCVKNISQGIINEVSTILKRKDFNKLIQNYFLNELTFIHFIEFIVFLDNQHYDINLRLQLNLFIFNLLVAYFIWQKSQKSIEKSVRIFLFLEI